MTVVAETMDGRLRTTRSVKLPCAVEQPRQITAQMHGGRVIVTIPADALSSQPEVPTAGPTAPLGAPSAEPAKPPAEHAAEPVAPSGSAPAARGAERAAPAGPKEPKAVPVHVYPPKAGKMEVDHDKKAKSLRITVHGMDADGIAVDIEGKMLHANGRAWDQSSDVHKVFKLPARVLKPEAIKAVYEPALHDLLITIPDDALERKDETARLRHKIAVG